MASKPAKGQHGGPRLKVRHDDLRGSRPGETTMLAAPLGGGGGSIGQKPFVPTDEHRRLIMALTKVLNHDMIAAQLGISKITLYRHFEHELQAGKAEAIKVIGGKILAQAMEGCRTSQIFYLKTVGGWTQNHRHEHTGPGGGPIQTFDFSSFLEGKSIDELDAIIPVLEQLCAAAGVDGYEGVDGLDAGDEGPEE